MGDDMGDMGGMGDAGGDAIMEPLEHIIGYDGIEDTRWGRRIRYEDTDTVAWSGLKLALAGVAGGAGGGERGRRMAGGKYVCSGSEGDLYTGW